MKNISLILGISLLLISCGGNEPTVDDLIAADDMAAIQAKKSELNKQKTVIEDQVAQLQKYIADHSEAPAKKDVSAMTVTDTTFVHYIELQGSVDTKENITIMPEMPGALTQVFVKKGQRVSKGQRLARIDDGGMSQNIEQMKVQAQLAQTTYERQKRLWEQNIGSEIQYLQTKATYEAQQKAISSMERQLAKTIVTAPFSGTIDDVITEQGTVVSPGMPLFRIVSLKNMYIEVDVPETYITTIKKGTEVLVDFPVLQEKMESKVRETSSVINPANRSYSIEIPVSNTSGNVKPNLSARLSINDYTAQNAILVPLSVISENQEGEQYVMVVAQGENGIVAKRRPITTGKASGDLIEITSGLKVGDQVITEGARTVKEDQEIAIKNS